MTRMTNATEGGQELEAVRMARIADDLEDVQASMLELLDEAQGLVREAGGMVRRRAEAYWLPNIRRLVEGAAYETSMATTVEELREEAGGS